MKKLNICLISLAIPPDSLDGESVVFKNLFEYLKKQGHRVTLITGKWNYQFNDPSIIQINFFFKKRFFWFPQFVLSVYKFLRSHKFDIIHGNGPKSSLPIILSNQKRFISTIHDLGPFETKFTLIPFEKFLINQAIKKATSITTVSNFIRREIKYFISKVNINKIYTLYNGIEEKFKPYPKEAQKLKQKLNIDGPVVLYLGRIAQYKSVDDIIAAYKIAKKEIPELNLAIGGLPDFTMKKTYEKWKINNKDIHFLGFVPEKEIPFYYSMADIFITYSYASEGFGLTPVEAIACGTPVICSSLLVFKEILRDNAIFVPPKSPQLLSKEIINLLKEDNLRKLLIEKGQKFIKRYSWDEVGKRLEKVYYQFSKN